MPWFGMFTVLFFMANSGLPGTSGFVGEFTVIIASFHASFWISLGVASMLLLGAAYSLWLVKRVLYGQVANDNVRSEERRVGKARGSQEGHADKSDIP